METPQVVDGLVVVTQNCLVGSNARVTIMMWCDEQLEKKKFGTDHSTMRRLQNMFADVRPFPKKKKKRSEYAPAGTTIAVQ